METEKSKTYLRAKEKVQHLKAFYNHTTIYIVSNAVIILINAGLFKKGPMDFTGFQVYFVAVFWGIGLIWHAIYMVFVLYVNIDFIKRWENKKINEFMEKQDNQFN